MFLSYSYTSKHPWKQVLRKWNRTKKLFYKEIHSEYSLSYVYLKTCFFHVFQHRESENARKNSLGPVSYRILSLFYKTNFYSVNSVWWHLDLEILDMPPRRFLLLGKPFCAKSMSFFLIFSINPIFNLVTANDRYKNSPKGLFYFFPRFTSRGFITNLVEKIE